MVRAPRRVAARVREASRKITGHQRLLYLLWFIQLFSPHFLIATFAGGLVKRIPLVLIAILSVQIALAKPEQGKKQEWLPGPALWLLMMIGTLPFALNMAKAKEATRLMASFFIVALGVVRGMKTPRDARMIIYLVCAGQFLWWGVLGLKSGAVYWHPTIANQDGYGPAMVVGIGPAYFYAMSVPPGRRRNLALLTAALCVGGVVSSFARGAFLCMVAVFGYIWYRSPRRGRAAGFILAAASVLGIASMLVDGKSRDPLSKSNIISEVLTSFDSNDGTGNDRKAIWGAARSVFYHKPIFGAGVESFGAGAAELFTQGKLGAVQGAYADNPLTLYDRAIHNTFYQILSENGLVGTGIFIFILVQFWKQLKMMRDPRSTRVWKANGGIEDLEQLSLGFECGMIGFLTTGYFYNQLWDVWMWFLVFTSALVFRILTVHLRMPEGPAGANPRGPRGRRIGRPMQPQPPRPAPPQFPGPAGSPA